MILRFTSKYIINIFKQNYECKNILRSLIPKWEEIIVFNESFSYFTQEHPNILVMFEVSYI